MSDEKEGSITEALLNLYNRTKDEKLKKPTKHVLDFKNYNARVRAVNSFIQENGLLGTTVAGVKFKKYIQTQPNAAMFYKLLSTKNNKLAAEDIPKLLMYEQAIKTFTELSNIVGEIAVPNKDGGKSTITIVNNAGKYQKGKTLHDMEAGIYGGAVDKDGEVKPFGHIDITKDMTVEQPTIITKE